MSDITKHLEPIVLSIIDRRDPGKDAEKDNKDKPVIDQRYGSADFDGIEGGGGNIASPVVETDINLREYWPEQIVPSSDGLFYMALTPIKKIFAKDANGEDVVVELAEKIY